MYCTVFFFLNNWNCREVTTMFVSTSLYFIAKQQETKQPKKKKGKMNIWLVFHFHLFIRLFHSWYLVKSEHSRVPVRLFSAMFTSRLRETTGHLVSHWTSLRSLFVGNKIRFLSFFLFVWPRVWETKGTIKKSLAPYLLDNHNH